MTGARASGPEQLIDGFAATIFAMCVAWSLTLWGIAPIGAVGGGAVGAVIALVGLRRVSGAASVFAFELFEPEFEEPDDDTLLLEDRLETPAQDSQVVRLFAVGASRASHVPGELAARIDSFLDSGRAPLRAVPAQPDAAQELYQALAEIRRTLR